MTKLRIMAKAVGVTVGMGVVTSALAFGSRPVEQPMGIDGGSPGDMDCVMQTGAFSVHLSAYQKLASESLEKHCRDIPSIGPTHLVFDLHSVDRRVRELPLRFRIVEEPTVAPGEARAASPGLERTLQDVPAQSYKTGVVEMDTNFDKAGRYLVLVDSATGDKTESLRIPLQVGGSEGENGSMLIGIFGVLLGLAATLMMGPRKKTPLVP